MRLVKGIVLSMLAFSAFACKPDQIKLDTELISSIGNNNEAEAARLLGQGANPNAVDKGPNRSFTALILSVQNPKIVRLLLAKGAKTDKNDGNGLSPFYYAVAIGTLDSVKELVGAGADIHFREPSGGNLLHAAVGNDSTNIVTYLLDAKLDVNQPDSHGLTPLHHLAMSPFKSKNRSEMLRLLIARGADRTATDKKRRTPYFYAKTKFFRKLTGTNEFLDILRPPTK